MNEKMTMECSDRQKELRNCTFAKTILMLIVVLYHSILFWKGDWFTANPTFQSTGLSILSQWMNTFHIYAFTLISGYIFYYIKYEKGGYSHFRPFVCNKLKRLIVPYVFALLWVIPAQILFIGYDAKELFINYVLAVAPSQLWFLMMLFVVFIIAFFLADFWKKAKWRGLILTIGIYIAGIIASMFLPNVFMIWRACEYILFFYIGFMIRSGMIRFPRCSSVIAGVGHLILFALLQLLRTFDHPLISLLQFGLNKLICIVGAVAAFLILQAVANHLRWDNKLFRFFAQRSMVVYLLHQQIIYCTIYWLNGTLNPYVHAVFNFIVALLISIVIASLLLKWKVTRFLVGEK